MSLLSHRDALELVLARVEALPVEEVAPGAGVGRVLAADAYSTVDLPPFDSSAMDGFAVRAADTPGRLPLVGGSAAGAPFAGTLAAGRAVSISTGAVVPAGADAVVPVEHALPGDGAVEVERVAAGAHVRRRGGDVSRGALVAARGAPLTPLLAAALVASGVERVACRRRAHVAVLATGSELRSPGAALGPGEIYESNSTLLCAQLVAAGAEPRRLPAVPDDAAATRAALADGLRADVLVTTGGVSVGAHDLVRASLAGLGVEEVFWGVAIKPGKPLAFSTAGRTLVFGLPGNPLASLVGLELFVRPALRALAGSDEPRPLLLPGVLGAELVSDSTRTRIVASRLRVDGEVVVLDPLRGEESHQIARAATANALVMVEPRGGRLAAGSPVSYLPL